VAGCLLAGGATCVALGVAGFIGLDRQIHDFQRVSVPGQAMVRFTQPGGYVLYVEKPGSCCSFSIDSGGGSGSGSGPPFTSWSMRVALRPVAGGPLVPVHTWRGATESYAAAGRQGQTALYFTIAHPGAYYLAATNVTPRSITDLAAGRGIGESVFIYVLLPLIGIFVLAPGGLLVGIITAVRRRGARRAQSAAPWTPPPGPATPPGQAGRQPAPAQPHGSQLGGMASPGQGDRPSGLAPPSPVPPAPADPDREAGAAPDAQTMQAPGPPPPGPLLPPSPLLPPDPLLPPSPLTVPSLPLPPSAARAAVPPTAVPPTAVPPTSVGPATSPSPPASPPPAPVPPPAGAEDMPAARPAAPPAPADRTGPPGRPRRRRTLLLLAGGAAVAILIAPFLINALTSHAPASRPAAATPAGASPGAPSASTQAPPTSAPLAGSKRWLRGLELLQTRMTDAMGGADSTVTADSLRAQAGELRRCSSELARLGAPPAQLRPESRLARRACAGFEQGARCDEAAAREFANFDPTAATPDPKLTRLFRCSDAGINKGSELISTAVAEASISA
jgi:hypothetical protein